MGSSLDGELTGEVKTNGQINIYDKKRNIWFENVCQFEDVGDWGDEYDYSGPTRKKIDKKYTTKDAEMAELTPFLNGPSQKSLKIKMILKLPVSLSPDRSLRQNILIKNTINLYISLYKGINRIDFKIELENKSKDHRFRVLFPSKIKSETIFCDGHFDELRIWTDIRTAQEISDNYQTELVGNEANLVGYWKFNNDLTDETSNSYDLTGVNSPTFSTDIPSWAAATVPEPPLKQDIIFF